MAFDIHIDSDGIPYSDYGEYGGLMIGRQRSILSVAERGLWYWAAYGLGSSGGDLLLSYNWDVYPKDRSVNPHSPDDAVRMMIACADWLCARIVHRDGFAVWEYSYPVWYETPAGWRSAHAQAVGMQLLVRAAQLQGNGAYLNELDQLLNAFDVPVDEGGLMDDLSHGVRWYEKFAALGNQRPKVLNGMLFAVIGLLDVYETTGLLKAKQFADEGAASAASLLPLYDLGDWSAYDAMGKRASQHYHEIHIRQLELLSTRYSIPCLASYRRRFVRYARAESRLVFWRRLTRRARRLWRHAKCQ